MHLHTLHRVMETHSSQLRAINTVVEYFIDEERPMVPLKYAIANGPWLFATTSDEDITFQCKALAFERIDLKSVDEPEKLEHIDVSSNVWILKLEIVNLSRKPCGAHHVRKRLILKDADGFEFHNYSGGHLNLQSQFSKSSGLYNFWSDPLPPKVRKSGAMAYELPDEFEDLFISVHNGNLQEA